MRRSPTSPEPTRARVRGRRRPGPRRSKLHLVWAALAGLLLSPFAYLVVVFSLASRFSTGWFESDLESMGITSLLLALLGAVYWCVVFAWLRGRSEAGRWWRAAGAFVLLVAGVHILVVGW